MRLLLESKLLSFESVTLSFESVTLSFESVMLSVESMTLSFDNERLLLEGKRVDPSCVTTTCRAAPRRRLMNAIRLWGLRRWRAKRRTAVVSRLPSDTHRPRRGGSLTRFGVLTARGTA
jgi:hypothetical protein